MFNSTVGIQAFVGAWRCIRLKSTSQLLSSLSSLGLLGFPIFNFYQNGYQPRYRTLHLKLVLIGLYGNFSPAYLSPPSFSFMCNRLIDIDFADWGSLSLGLSYHVIDQAPRIGEIFCYLSQKSIVSFGSHGNKMAR